MARKAFVVDSANVRASALRQYEPLQDAHLAMYFSSPSVRRILRQGGIVNENGELMQKGRPHLPKVVLPPLAHAPPPAQSLKPSASTTTRLGNPKEDPKSVRKPPDMRASEGSWKSPSSRSHFGVKTLKPLSHEEYVNLLQKYVGETPKAQLAAVPEQPKATEPVQTYPTTTAEQPGKEETAAVEADKSQPPNSGAN